MLNMSGLRYNDLVSPTLSPDEYLKLYKDELVIKNNFERYTPKLKILEKIKKQLREKNQKLKMWYLSRAYLA